MTQKAEVTSAIQAALDRCAESGSPGAIVAVDAPHLNLSFAGASGLFSKTDPRPLQAEDAFRAASVTKAVTAATAVRLAAEDRWSLDGPVAPYLPGHLPDRLLTLEGLESLEPLTIRRLLNHTSGLPDYFFDQRFRSRVKREPGRIWQPRELVEAAVAAGSLAFQPGTGFSYGDTGYVLVGLAIESLLGCSLAEAYRALIFAPLRMEATFLEWREPSRGSTVSHHYDADRDLLPMNLSFDWAGGGLVTTAGDLVRFLRGLFSEALFDARWLKEMTRWRDDLQWRPDSSARYRRYGLGIGVNSACGVEIFGATGVWGAFAYHCPGNRAAIAGTVNQRRMDRSILLDAILCALRGGRE